jgi:hypothetical protein
MPEHFEQDEEAWREYRRIQDREPDMSFSTSLDWAEWAGLVGMLLVAAAAGVGLTWLAWWLTKW